MQDHQVAHRGMTPMGGGGGAGQVTPFQLPSINVGGSSAPGGVAVELLANGVTIGKVELYNLHQPLPSQAPGNRYMGGAIRQQQQYGNGYAPGVGAGGVETLGRPSLESMRRRRSASVMSVDAEAHDRPPLIDRIQPGIAPPPPLVRNDGNFDGDNFAVPMSRPHSRVSNNGGPPPGFGQGGWGGPPPRGPGPFNNFNNHNNNGFVGGPGFNPRFRPYSANSNRSFQSGPGQGPSESGSFRPQRDSYYPRYQNQKKVGEYTRLPEDKQKPWFTPVPTGPDAASGSAILIEHLTKGTTPGDLWLTAKEYGALQFVEVVEELENELTMLIVYNHKHDADWCVQKLDGISADGSTLRASHTKLSSLYRPYENSTNILQRVTSSPERDRSSSVFSSNSAQSGVTGAAGGGPAASVQSMAAIPEGREDNLDGDISLT